MGVVGTGGAGWGAGRAPSPAAYFVALAGIVLLLLLLCCYVVYFCCRKVAEISKMEAENQRERLASATASAPPTYPVHKSVRESAETMASLCRQLPSASISTDSTGYSSH